MTTINKLNRPALLALLLSMASLAPACAYAQSSSHHQSGSSSYGQDQEVSGYTRSNGTEVQPYHRTERDNTQTDNYSAQGNTNPYTGQPGTHRSAY